MMEDCKDNIMTVNDQVVLAVLTAQKEHGVQSHFKLWAGPNEGAPHRLCLSVPFELDSDEMASRTLFWLWEGVGGGVVSVVRFVVSGSAGVSGVGGYEVTQGQIPY